MMCPYINHMYNFWYLPTELEGGEPSSVIKRDSNGDMYLSPSSIIDDTGKSNIDA